LPALSIIKNLLIHNINNPNSLKRRRALFKNTDQGSRRQKIKFPIFVNREFTSQKLSGILDFRESGRRDPRSRLIRTYSVIKIPRPIKDRIS